MQAFEITIIDVLSSQNVCFSETICGKILLFSTWKLCKRRLYSKTCWIECDWKVPQFHCCVRRLQPVMSENLGRIPSTHTPVFYILGSVLAIIQ